MPDEPKSIREANFVIAGIDARLGLVQKMVWAVIALLGTLLAGAGAFYIQVGELKTDIAVIKTNVTAINERAAKIEKNIEERVLRSLNRIDALLTPGSNPQPRPDRSIVIGPSLLLSDWEVQIVLDVLKPDRSNEPGQFKIGDTLPDVILPRLPEAILAKVPKLRMFRYTIDRNGSILLVEDRGRTVVGIISPT